MPWMHLGQCQDLHIVLVDYSLKKETIKKIKLLDKACFQHDIAYGDFKYLNRKTFANKVLHDNAFDVAKDSKYDDYQHGITSMVYKFWIKNYTKNYTNQLLENLKKE